MSILDSITKVAVACPNFNQNINEVLLKLQKMVSMDGPKFPKGTRLFFVNYEFLENRENILSLKKYCNFIQVEDILPVGMH